MLRFKHQTVFGLCLTVVLLTGAVVASIALMLFERQDVAVLQQRIADLASENADLKFQLQNATRLQVEAPAPATGNPARMPSGENRAGAIITVKESSDTATYGQADR